MRRRGEMNAEKIQRLKELREVRQIEIKDVYAFAFVGSCPPVICEKGDLVLSVDGLGISLECEGVILTINETQARTLVFALNRAANYKAAITPEYEKLSEEYHEFISGGLS
jgi:hypothetical protein